MSNTTVREFVILRILDNVHAQLCNVYQLWFLFAKSRDRPSSQVDNCLLDINGSFHCSTFHLSKSLIECERCPRNQIKSMAQNKPLAVLHQHYRHDSVYLLHREFYQACRICRNFESRSRSRWKITGIKTDKIRLIHATAE